ncbi:CzcE family metal-binding protein [Aquabacterium sp. J223]|jgi:hypothetical protein|uniref:CzcE family metal-binding protein n=1 Tax=Aquabacterium sp. J223 TaxID=2898431 RepID=UPI0021ADE466|nr:CzcE family metal-binding protein [Aquabacterium sp. J223]UUX96656.1 CzcE family metal-binding protein [Aquabacterium sp. J223]
MNTSRIFRVAALTLATALPFHGMAMGTDVFRNGQSKYGQPAAAGAPSARVVDVSTLKSLTVAYGDTVTFQVPSGMQFSWTFNGLDGLSVPVTKIAPGGFPSTKATIHVQANPLAVN